MAQAIQQCQETLTEEGSQVSRTIVLITDGERGLGDGVGECV